MPLTRLNDSAFDAQLEGVYFGMWNGSTPVRCLVTHEALTDKAQGSGQQESFDVFHQYRFETENLAAPNTTLGRSKATALFRRLRRPQSRAISTGLSLNRPTTEPAP